METFPLNWILLITEWLFADALLEYTLNIDEAKVDVVEFTIVVMGDYFCGTVDNIAHRGGGGETRGGINDCVRNDWDWWYGVGLRGEGGVIKEILHTKAPSNFIQIVIYEWAMTYSSLSTSRNTLKGPTRIKSLMAIIRTSDRQSFTLLISRLIYY